MHRRLLFGAFFFSFLIVLPLAASADSVRIDEATLQKGYTLDAMESAIRVGVWPGVIHEPVEVKAVEIPPIAPEQLPEGYRVMSPFYQVSISSLADPSKPMIVDKPYTIAIRVPVENAWAKDVWLYDNAKKEWVIMPSTMDLKRGETRAWIHHSFLWVVALERETAVEGIGSWYADRRDDSAASNDFPIGSTLRVTEKETGASTDVVVRSTGPFVPGRVIDLAKTAFAKLKSVRAGVGEFKVELISLP